MGEIAELMLEGTMCQGCGEYIDDDFGDGPGFPRYCSGCESRRADRHPAPTPRQRRTKPRTALKGSCPSCGKRFATQRQADQHARDAHKAIDADTKPEGGSPAA